MSDLTAKRPRVLATRSSSRAKSPEPTNIAPFEAAPNVIDESGAAARFDPVRFSDMRRGVDLKESHYGRTLLFVAIVIVIGAGLLFLVQRFVLNQNNQTQTPTDTNTQVADDTSNSFVEIKTTVASAADTQVASNSNFTNTTSALGSAANNNGSISISKFTYIPFDKVTRLVWELDGITNGMPATDVSYSASEKEITVTFDGITVADDSMLGDFSTPSGNATEISVSEAGTDVVFEISLVNTGKYHVSIVGTQIQLDIKSDAQLTQPSDNTSVATDTEDEEDAAAQTPATNNNQSSSTASSTKPAAPHYDNTAAKDKTQYISSAVDSATIASSSYYYVDNGDNFQFSWAMQGTGATSIPNTTAKKIVENGTTFIEVKMENLYYDYLHSQAAEKANIQIPLTGTAIVDVFTHEYDVTKGTATFRVQLRNADASFRLHSTIVWEGYQLVSLQVFD